MNAARIVLGSALGILLGLGCGDDGDTATSGNPMTSTTAVATSTTTTTTAGASSSDTGDTNALPDVGAENPCGWGMGPGGPQYVCGGGGADPGGGNPFNCPPDAMEGGPCGSVGRPGCCVGGDVLFCDITDTIARVDCQ